MQVLYFFRIRVGLHFQKKWLDFKIKCWNFLSNSPINNIHYLWMRECGMTLPSVIIILNKSKQPIFTLQVCRPEKQIPWHLNILKLADQKKILWARRSYVTRYNIKFEQFYGHLTSYKTGWNREKSDKSSDSEQRDSLSLDIFQEVTNYKISVLIGHNIEIYKIVQTWGWGVSV